MYLKNARFSDNFKNQAQYYPYMTKKRFLSHNAMDKIMREVGALRVSDDAKAALANAMEQKALEVSTEAKKLAEHAGRKTITEKDIHLANK
jgi:DNA-binding protein